MERGLADFVKVSNNFEALASLEVLSAEAERATITTTSTRSQPATPTSTAGKRVGEDTSVLLTRRKQKNRNARKAASAKKMMGEMVRVQVARGLHGIIEEDIEDILNPDQECQP